MYRVIALPLLLALLAASAPPRVEVATGDWSELPQLRFVGYDHLDAAVLTRIHEIVRTRQCQIPGQSGSRTDLSISFAVQYSPKGELQRLLLPRLNCPAAESWLGAALLKSIQKGDYRSSGENPEGWYQGSFSFDYGN